MTRFSYVVQLYGNSPPWVHAQPLAEHIEDLRFTRDGNMLTVTLTARTPTPDPHYTHPHAQDGYRRLTLTSTVRLRGLPLALH